MAKRRLSDQMRRWGKHSISGWQKGWKGVAGLLMLGAVMALVPFYLGLATQEAARAACLPVGVSPDPTQPDLDCAAPPNTFDVSSFFASNADSTARAMAGPTWDVWAWASFAAMNWPAKQDPSLPTGFVRGVPSPTATFETAKNYDVLVWETFKEKRELFNSTINASSAWQDITFDPAQQPTSVGGQIEMCPGTTTSVLSKVNPHRIISQATKAASVVGDNTFDETVEVASPAREMAATLCAGYTATTNPTYDACVQGIFPDAYVNRRTPVGPRVWKGDPSQAGARPVFFEVKVNYDFWNYILENGFYDDTTAYAAARGVERDDIEKSLPPSEQRLAHPKLPFRTSASQGPGRSPNARFAYQADSTVAAFARLSDLNALPRVGSVQVKLAWLLLDPAVEDTSQYHTTYGIYYKTAPSAPDSICYTVGHFGLLGMHIIQRVHAIKQNLENTEFAHGGTFIFATWEHTGLGAYQQPTGYYYANFLAKQTGVGNLPFPFGVDTTSFPNIKAANAIQVVRQKPYPLASTASVNTAVHQALGCPPSGSNAPGSVWCNYQLIGTQFLPVDSETESIQYNQPYYLANLVVETNEGLQNFSGLPPELTVTPYYTDKVSIEGTGVAFEPDHPNVIFNRELKAPLNMGGCMGCHGVAQLNGYNFSFVFQDGQRGSGLDTQLHFEVAGSQGVGFSNE